MFVTGGTGFIGTWLIESLLWARREYCLDVEICILSREPQRFLASASPLIKTSDVAFQTGDVRDFTFPSGRFTHIIHAATEASARLNADAPFEMLDTIVGGTKRVCLFATHSGAKILLNTSSGGVYGPQPTDMANVGEEYYGAPDPMDPLAVYSESKRLSEMIGRISSEASGFEHKVARITALVGPRLPLNIHYAMGNFIRDALRGGPIIIKGNGTPVRSYMYIADLVIWLWIIFIHGKSNRPYNVGSETGISLSEAASAVCCAFETSIAVVVQNRVLNDGRPNRYVPSTQRAQSELGLRQWIDFPSAIQRTVDWYRLQ